MTMRKTAWILVMVLLSAACGSNERQLKGRAAELCRYIPDHRLIDKSKDYLTADFYAVLDTMFNHLPEHEAMDHEWLYYFVTGNGGTIADYEVSSIERSDPTHAVATIMVRQRWEDGSFDENTDVEEHKLYMEKGGGRWLMSDFDGHKQDCIRHIGINRREQAVRNAVSDYLVREIGPRYLQGELCIPTLIIIAGDDTVESDQAQLWCDCFVFWYNVEGDTLKTVSGGNHSGCMTLREEQGQIAVTAFEQTVDGEGNDASARRIFGPHYDIFRNVHSNRDVQEAVRREQLQEYVRRNRMGIRFYQDYGWDAVEL